MTHLLLAVIYLAFISLGLPDGLLGAVWPMMQPQFAVPVAYAGVVSMIISVGTITSSLMSDRATKALGCGWVTVCSVAMTVVGLFGFSYCTRFWMLCLWAVPYGLGAGGVDAALNNYVALHYSSRHMSWLHCMWGVGASVGPYIMGAVLSGGRGWPAGYRTVGAMQLVLVAVLLFSLPLWSRPGAGSASGGRARALGFGEILRIPGAKAVFLMFFCYCALEVTAGLWAASFMVAMHGVTPERAADYAGLFYIGITVGRAVGGFAAAKLDDDKMILTGTAILSLGVIILALPLGSIVGAAGLLLIGLGCAPIYPCVIHSTPAYFGPENAQAIIGVQMASAYVGSCLTPPLFGLLAGRTSVLLLPACLGGILLVMYLMHRRLRVLGKKS